MLEHNVVAAGVLVRVLVPPVERYLVSLYCRLAWYPPGGDLLFPSLVLSFFYSFPLARFMVVGLHSPSIYKYFRGSS